MDKKFREPELNIKKVYTKTGDSGKTRLVGGQQLDKDNLRIVCYGEIDELNSIVGICIENLKHNQNSNIQIKELINILIRIQHELFNLGTLFATLPKDQTDSLPKIDNSHIENIEKNIDYFNNSLPSLKSFVLPGGSMNNCWLHLARTVCRRVERNAISLNKVEILNPHCIQYINRLSDAFFVFSRWIIFKEKKQETLWDPNKS